MHAANFSKARSEFCDVEMTLVGCQMFVECNDPNHARLWHCYDLRDRNRFGFRAKSCREERQETQAKRQEHFNFATGCFPPRFRGIGTLLGISCELSARFPPSPVAVVLHSRHRTTNLI